MMAKTVNINDCEFDTSEVKVNKGKKISFMSTNNNSYTLDCGSNNSKISKYFPFPVPGDGKKHDLKIKDKAIDGSYDCEIIDGCSKVKEDAPRPTMIIKVE